MAIMCKEPERLKEFYSRWFGFEELGRTPGGTIHITDGYFNMALMKHRADIAEEDQRLGLHHIGFEIESLEEIRRRLRDFHPSIKIEERPKGRRTDSQSTASGTRRGMLSSCRKRRVSRLMWIRWKN
jgi:catechol 2,3-dioxygenase-like lactoylglutathione lyase family enzyme